ncbi:MAG: hypothetical protein HC934_08075 [Acaryochloridaceae cyanobacterium SU_2_1]|nr:hypothetical protein [Acaryochloridaceae cyanobacterium SU_2_1]
MLALYTLGAGLIMSGLFILFTIWGGRLTRRNGPIPGFVAAVLMAFLGTMPIGTMVNFIREWLQTTGHLGRVYYFVFVAGIGIPVIVGWSCALLLFSAALVARHKQKLRHRSHRSQ